MSTNSLIKLESTLDVSKLSTAKLQQNFVAGNTAKVSVPQCDGKNFEGVLYTIQEFEEASLVLDFDEGPHLFHNFRQCVIGTARDDWQIASKNADDTPEGFEASLVAFKRIYMTNETKQNLINHMKSLKKPRAMSVHDFISRLRTLNRYVAMLPDADIPNAPEIAKLPESEIKIQCISVCIMHDKFDERNSNPSLAKVNES